MNSENNQTMDSQTTPTTSRNETAQGRIERWRQKLLDFSARNRLLNIPRASRQVIPLVCPDVAALEDQIASNVTITVRSSEDAAGNPASELANHRLLVEMPPREVCRRLNNLYHDARTELEESGVNTLFLAIGSLQWMEPGGGAARKSYRAPILMLPVRLERATIAQGVKLLRLDEDTTLNTTLVEFLRAQFGIQITGLDPLPTDEKGVDISAVLNAFRAAIQGMEGWSVLEEAHLGCFSFGKFVMWKDLTDRVDEFRRNPLVNHLIGGGGIFDDGVAVFPPEEVSSHVHLNELFCPVSYDSSQLTAVLYSAMGKTFVLHGPPGTGKSQTITNIIAHNLALGRRVLFVSEKKAALDVVKNRLDRIGLTPFCLELHSNKTEKRRFYAQLKEAIEVASASVPAKLGETIANFEKTARELDQYVAALHHRYPNGLSAYDCFARAIKYGSGAHPELIAADTLGQSSADYLAAGQVVQELLNDYRGMSLEAEKALPAMVIEAWSPVQERQLTAAAHALAEAVREADGLYRRIYAEIGVEADCSREGVRALVTRLAMVANFPLGVFLYRLVSKIPLFDRFKVFGLKRETIDEALARWNELKQRRAELARFVDDSALDRDFASLLGVCAAIEAHATGLRDVLRYRRTLARARLLGVGAFADFFAAGDSAALDVAQVFERAYAAKMLDEILARTPVLAEFTGLVHEERVARFRQLDREYTALAQKAIFARLAQALRQRLAAGPATRGSELGLVKRECEKKIRHKAVRLALAEARTLIPALKPCFLMSPLSVAQYLPVDAEPFDLVVFDEASQIPVWDAVGVIARARQLVVVGDPKQMPPTNFFQKGDVEDEDEIDDTIVDQESVLDECLVAGVHSTYLNWHYRSRHESLIAFSNEHYYEGRLCTFPSAMNTPRLGVRFMFVEGGRFARQGAGPRVNEVEARALVDYICTEVLKPGYRRRSIGVVTFSMPQQKLILDLLEERRGENPELEAMLPEEGEGAYFVKNLENVQGDESDVILFSVGYAPDENGRFTMNFGPLNLSGGERRLNVAITRAREQVVVFSSIHATQIDAGEDGRTKAVGAGHLKAFLDYAEHGGGQAGDFTAAGGEAFSDVVAEFLVAKGYQVERNVGCSDYRVDVAVCMPGDPDRYLMGIECDGPAYAAQRTAQDREVNRAGVLQGLGWRMCRVWSADWAFDRERAEKRLLAALEAGLTQKGV